MDREDGEMSDDSAMLVDSNDEPTTQKDDNFTVLYKASKTGLEIKTLEKVDATKLEERAKRFGLNLTGNRVVTQRQIDELYNNCGIESGNERHFRFDALHLNGVDGLSTRDIFQYLEDYKPLSLEWIDDISCNVVCQDHISAALALLVHSREIRSKELKDMLAEKSDHHWREGIPHPKKDLILMRFATNGDKKMAKKKPDTKKILINDTDQNMDSVSKNPWGDLCKSWGVYDHQEVFQRKLPKNDYEDEIEEPPKVFAIKNKKLAMRLGKREHTKSSHHSDDESNSDSEWRTKSKAPRMRMHADDEESKMKKKKTDVPEDDDNYEEKYTPLSIEVVNSHSNYTQRTSTKLSDKFKYHNVRQGNVHKRLGGKIETRTDYSDNDMSSDNSDTNVVSKVQKVSSGKSSSSVWSRLEGKQSSQSDLRQVIKSRVHKKPDDLRERISKPKKSNLRIEIDNISD